MNLKNINASSQQELIDQLSESCNTLYSQLLRSVLRGFIAFKAHANAKWFSSELKQFAAENCHLPKDTDAVDQLVCWFNTYHATTDHGVLFLRFVAQEILQDEAVYQALLMSGLNDEYRQKHCYLLIKHRFTVSLSMPQITADKSKLVEFLVEYLPVALPGWQQFASEYRLKTDQLIGELDEAGTRDPRALLTRSDHQQRNKNTEHNESNAAITSLSKDIVLMLAFYYLSPPCNKPPTDASHLAQTCKFFQRQLQPHLNNFGAKKLVQHVVYGEKDSVKKMLDGNPELLLHTATAMDYSGRTIKEATAFEAALGAGDTDMARIIVSYFPRLKDIDGERERSKQYHKQLPKDLPEQDPYDFSAVVDAITRSDAADIRAQRNHEHRDSLICKAISQFREDFTPGVITTGSHFNHQNLIKVFEIYDQEFGNRSRDKQDLFWRQVLGYVQRFMPACDAQAFAQGIYSIVGRNESLKRSFKFRLDDEEHLFPLRAQKKLGFDWARGVGPVFHASAYGEAIGGRVRPGAAWPPVGAIRKLYGAKASDIIKLGTGPTAGPDTTTCLIC